MQREFWVSWNQRIVADPGLEVLCVVTSPLLSDEKVTVYKSKGERQMTLYHSSNTWQRIRLYLKRFHVEINLNILPPILTFPMASGAVSSKVKSWRRALPPKIYLASPFKSISNGRDSRSWKSFGESKEQKNIFTGLCCWYTVKCTLFYSRDFCLV